MQEIKIRYVIKLGNGKILIKIFTIDEIQNGVALVWLIKNIDDGDIISRDLFTGKQDKNGKDIYQGDILRDSTGICLVSWNNDFASFCLRRKGWAYDHFFGEAVDSNDTEIIGNNHQNHELSEGKNENN